MAMWRAKYGESTMSACPICGRPAIVRNDQGIPVCVDHKRSSVSGKCPMCSGDLELRDGKFGKFFLCGKCGPVSMKKAEMQSGGYSSKTGGTASPSEKAKERANAFTNPDGTTKWVRSDDARFEFR
jgi:ribosomal protein L37AE/L43A